MQSRALSLALVALCCSAGVVRAQPTPTPVSSNAAPTSFAQSYGNPCASRGKDGCGGCYPQGLVGDFTAQLITVNPEWAPIGPMIDTGGGVRLDTRKPPDAAPRTMTGTVVLSKINQGGDFPASHVTDDQNTFIQLDSTSASLMATGNQADPSCPGEGCNFIEMEREIGKYPLFAWAGEGDRVTATGRWIFDCGHPDVDPLGKCTTTGTDCILDGDCTGGNTCTAPAPTFNYRAEMHPGHALVVFRNSNKGIGKVPGSQADVYITSDGGGAGDKCTVTHHENVNDLLSGAKACFLNACSSTTYRTCTTSKQCPGGETCLTLDPSGQLALPDLNTDVEFDLPLPPPPGGASTIDDLKIKTKAFKPKGGLMPKAIFTLPTTAALHVKIPMSVELTPGVLPNVFAGRITASWKTDTAALTKVRVTFQSVTVNNPLKPNTPAFSRQCFNGNPTGTACEKDTDCPASGTCFTAATACVNDAGCPKNDACSSHTYCKGGINPGWMMFAQANGDWGRLKKLDTVGAAAPFAAPPYVTPATPVPVKVGVKFDEYVPAGGTIHVTTTGTSFGCLDNLYGQNLGNDLNVYGLSAGADCLFQMPQSTGRVDATNSGTDFTTVSGASCTGPDLKGIVTCTATSDGGDGGNCSVLTNRLCISDTDCKSCSDTGGACTVNGDCKHCSNDASKFCTLNADCGTGNTCNAGSATCDATAGTCNITGGSFSLTYTLQKK